MIKFCNTWLGNNNAKEIWLKFLLTKYKVRSLVAAHTLVPNSSQNLTPKTYINANTYGKVTIQDMRMKPIKTFASTLTMSICKSPHPWLRRTHFFRSFKNGTPNTRHMQSYRTTYPISRWLPWACRMTLGQFCGIDLMMLWRQTIIGIMSVKGRLRNMLNDLGILCGSPGGSWT
jgi:hypothetical protein